MRNIINQKIEEAIHNLEHLSELNHNEEARETAIAALKAKAMVEDVKEKICDSYCKFPLLTGSQGTLENVCQNCPLNKI